MNNVNSKLDLGKRDVISYWSFTAYACCTIVLPLVLVGLSRDLNFPLDDGNKGAAGFLQMGVSILMVLSMLGCGFAAGRWGKAAVLGWANILLAIGVLSLAFAPGYWFVLTALAVAGIGEGILEGLLTPYLQDCHPVEPARYMNLGQAFSPGGMLLMVVLAALLPKFGVSWRGLVLVSGILTLIPGILYLLPCAKPESDGTSGVLTMSTVARQLTAIVLRGKFWVFFATMFFAGVGEFCLTFWTASYMQLEFKVSEAVASFAVGVWTFFMFCGRIGFGAWVREARLKSALVFFAIITLALMPFIPLSALYLPPKAAIICLFALLGLGGLSVAPFWVSIQSFCCVCMPKEDDTMIFILLSCAGIPGCGFAAWGMGILGDWIGLKAAFLMVPVCYFLMLAGILTQKQLKETA